MTEARLVTREQLAAALLLGETWAEVDERYDFGDFANLMTANEYADAIFADLPAAAPAEGLREALVTLHTAAARIHAGGSRNDLDDFEQAMIGAGMTLAALARHESGSE